MSLATRIKLGFLAAAVVLCCTAGAAMAANAVAGKTPRTTTVEAPPPAAEEPAPQPAPIVFKDPPPASVSPAPVSPQPIAVQPVSVQPAAPKAVPSAPIALAPSSSMSAPAPAAKQELLIKTGNHGDFARAVFEGTKEMAYRVTSSGNAIDVFIDTAAAPKIATQKTAQIRSVRAAHGPDGTLKVTLGVAPGATFKDFHFGNKIVVDVFAAPAKAAAAAPKKEKPAPAPAPAPAPKQQAAAPAAEKQLPAAQKPAEPVKLAAAPAPASAAAPAAPAPAAAAPAAKPAPAPEEPADAAPVLSDPEAIAGARLPGKPGSALPSWDLAITKPGGSAPVEAAPSAPVPVPAVPVDDAHTATLTLTSLSPMRIAVFSRFDALWVVTNATGTDASPPAVSGPMAGFIPAPKALKFRHGTAYRYALPRKFYPVVSKERLSWQVQLLPEPLPPSAARLSAEIRVQSDPKSHEAMMIAYLKGAGDAIEYVVPTSLPGQAVLEGRQMPDLEILPAEAGMVVRPLRDGLSVRHIMLTAEEEAEKHEGEEKEAAAETSGDAHPLNDVVVITAPSGLAVTPRGGAITLIGAADEASDNDNNRLFDFPNWRRGGGEKLQKSRQELQEAIAAAEQPEERAGLLMDLAKLYFANNFGQEALGVLDLVLAENPGMEQNPDFIAIRGAANAMSGRFKEALQDLSLPAIQSRPEASLWRGYAAAATEQWRMADRSFPKSNRLLLQYPDEVAIPFTIYMAESALHLGNTKAANELLGSIDKTAVAAEPRYRAAIDYLRGISYAQEGHLEKAAALWAPVAEGIDRLYHAKASLSLTRLLLQQKKITLKEATDRVDSLRFAWRGDGLEVSILHTLGALKVQGGQVLSGLEDMKRAADLADSMLDDSAPIREDMRRVFSDLFTSDVAGKVSPLEMVSVYNEFRSLIPPGPEAETAALNFIDGLIRMDLLSKAAALMEEQVKAGNMTDARVAALGTKLTAVYLLDSKPAQALDALLETERAGISARLKEERTLLKARAHSQMNETDAAIATLSALNSKNAQRLKADVLFRARRWAEAADAISTLLPDPSKPLTTEEASYVVDAAVALKLAGDMEKLAKIRDTYAAPMAATKLAATFGVVTRDGGGADLADRETMLGIAGEVDMFKGFLENYKAGLGSGS
jgi:hypothetical protein